MFNVSEPHQKEIRIIIISQNTNTKRICQAKCVLYDGAYFTSISPRKYNDKL